MGVGLGSVVPCGEAPGRSFFDDMVRVGAPGLARCGAPEFSPAIDVLAIDDCIESVEAPERVLRDALVGFGAPKSVGGGDPGSSVTSTVEVEWTVFNGLSGSDPGWLSSGAPR